MISYRLWTCLSRLSKYLIERYRSDLRVNSSAVQSKVNGSVLYNFKQNNFIKVPFEN